MSGIQDSLLPIFIEETEDGLALVQNLMTAWEDGPLDGEIIEEARRAAHTIKGTAGLVKRMRCSATAKDLEVFLDSFIDKNVRLTAEDIDQVKCLHGQLVELLDYAKQGESEPVEKSFEAESTSVAETIEQQGSDLINDFALPFMMKLHQATDELQETVKPVCCRFYLGGRQYFLPIENVVEISESAQITYLPYGPAYIPGLINLRGNVIPVIDLAALEGRTIDRPNNFFMVIAMQGIDLLAFICDTMPNLSLKAAGHKIDVDSLLDQHSVKAS